MNSLALLLNVLDISLRVRWKLISLLGVKSHPPAGGSRRVEASALLRHKRLGAIKRHGPRDPFVGERTEGQRVVMGQGTGSDGTGRTGMGWDLYFNPTASKRRFSF